MLSGDTHAAGLHRQTLKHSQKMEKDKKMEIEDISIEDINEIIHNPTMQVKMTNDTRDTPNKDAPLVTEIYKHTDHGPFYLIAEKKGIDHIDLGLSLKRIPNINLLNIVKIATNKVRIQARTYLAANKLIANKETFNLSEYNLYLPKQYVVTEGVIRNIHVKFTEDEIRENITTNYMIENVERLTTWDAKEKKSKPTTSVKISFRANNIPEQIHIAFCPVRVYIYVQRPLFCKTCLSYEHVAKYCKSKQPLCFNCSELKHDESTQCDTKCKICTRADPSNNDHRTSSYNCPAYKIQHEIKKIMAIKKICFWEAKAELIQQNPQPAKKPAPQNLLYSQIFQERPDDTASINNSQAQISSTPSNSSTKNQQQLKRNAANNDEHSRFILTLYNMVQASVANGSSGDHVLQQVSNSLLRYSEKNSLFENSITSSQSPINKTFHFNNPPSSKKLKC